MTFEQAAAQLVDVSRQLHRRGWVPATSGNFSQRLDADRVAITASGKDKSRLEASDILSVSLAGEVEGDGRPSAETGLHLQLYRRDPSIGAVLHTHALNAALATRGRGDHIALQGLELVKAFAGYDSHRSEMRIPVFDNRQDIQALANEVEQFMQQHQQGHAYLIRGHGVYTWGADLQTCMQHLEALDYLFAYYHETHRQEAP